MPAEHALVDLLGSTRARIVQLLRAQPRSVAALVEELALTEAAVRKHLGVLERDGFVRSQTVRRPGPGRPGSVHALTDHARRLFPDRSAELAVELLDWVKDAHGRSGLRDFLQWRVTKHSDRYAATLAGAGDDVAARTAQLAGLLSEDGFEAAVATVPAVAKAGTAGVPEGATVLELRQTHCAIADVAAAHPELCAHEAAMFQKLLGAPISRRQTIAGGASACVCTVTTTTSNRPAQATSTGA